MGRPKLLRFADTPPGRRVNRVLQRKLADRLRQRLGHALRGRHRTGSAVRDLGCDIPALCTHLEDQFLPGMTWGNYGCSRGNWNIDHITPLSSVDLTDRNQLLSVCHYTNLQPLWYEDNVRKGSIVGPRVIVDLREFCHA